MKQVMVGFLLIMVMLSAQVGRAAASEAAPANQTLTAVEDSYVDMTAPDSNFNGQSLAFEYSSQYDQIHNAYCPVVSKISYIKFDISAIDFNIDKARVRLSASECGAELIPLQLFAAEGEWSEESLTWNTRPAMSFQFAESAALDASGNYNWEDNSPAMGLADYLAYEQSRGTQTVTLGIIMQVSFGCTAESADTIGLLFNDHESSSMVRTGCAIDVIEPTLDVAAIDAELPTTQVAPTAVTLTTNAVEAPVSYSTVITIVFITLALTSARIVKFN